MSYNKKKKRKIENNIDKSKNKLQLIDKILENQLKILDIEPTTVKRKNIEIPEGKTYLLSSIKSDKSIDKQITGVYKTLKPRSFYDIKKWIGIPDQIASRIKQKEIKPITQMISPELIKSKTRISEEAEDNLYAVAKAFLFGDSSRVKQYENHLREFYRNPIIIGALLGDIIVNANATLTIAKDQKFLAARDIYIHAGGKINILSDYLKITCHNISGNI